MMKNVIVLTHGWTGSSVFTALIERAGAWSGEETHSKIDYNTHENVELIDLNRKMLADLCHDDGHHQEFNHQAVFDLAQRAESIDLTPYRKFVAKCDGHAPWIWKDPRLTWTIRIWARVLELDKIAFVVLGRDDDQAWISAILRRHIQTRKFSDKYNREIVASLKDFVTGNGCEFVEFEFEDLQLAPEKTVSALNDFLGSSLTLADVEAVYRQPLYRKSKSSKDKLLAYAIYYKNIREARRV